MDDGATYMYNKKFCTCCQDREEPSKMRVAQIVEPFKVVVKDLPEPVRAPGEVLVRMERVALCGSDLPRFSGEGYRFRGKYPLLEGQAAHECVGRVVEGGSFSPGEKVLVLPPKSNGLSELLSVPEGRLVPLPEDLDPDVSVMVQPLGTVLHALKGIGDVLGKDVAVVGQGPMGLLFTATLRRLGAKRVVGVDLLGYRLKVAREVGATDVIDVSRRDPVEAFAELGGVDVAVEAAGSPEALKTCIEALRRGGLLVQFGVPKEPHVPFPLDRFLRKDLRMAGFHLASAGNPLEPYILARDYIASGWIDPSPLITHHFNLEQVQRAYETAYRKKDGVVKAMVVF